MRTGSSWVSRVVGNWHGINCEACGVNKADGGVSVADGHDSAESFRACDEDEEV